MHNDTVWPRPAIYLQAEAATVTDANLFITDNDALWTALITHRGGDACPGDYSQAEYVCMLE